MNSSLSFEQEQSELAAPSPAGSYHSDDDDDEQKLSFGDESAGRRHFRADTTSSPRAYNFPILPMLDSSDEEEEASLVSSLSLDDSQLQHLRHHRRSPLNNDRFFDEIVEPRQRIQPPNEIFIATRPEAEPSTIVTNGMIETHQLPPSPMSSSCANKPSRQGPSRSSFAGQVAGLQHTTITTTATNDNAESLTPKPQLLRSTPHPLLISKPEVARRAATLPELGDNRSATSSRRGLGSEFSTPRLRQRPPLHSPEYSNIHSSPFLSSEATLFNSIPESTPETHSRRPRHRLVRTAGSLPLDRILVNGNFVTHVQLPNLPSDGLSMSSSPDDAKLLGLRPRRLIRRGVSGTVSVGSLVGQSTFITAPTASSSTVGMDTVESFQRHLKVQRMLNTIVAGPSETRPRSSRIQRELKCVWGHVSSPIQRWMDKLSPKSGGGTSSSGAGSYPSPHKVELKRAAGFLT